MRERGHNEEHELSPGARRRSLFIHMSSCISSLKDTVISRSSNQLHYPEVQPPPWVHTVTAVLSRASAATFSERTSCVGHLA